MPALFPSDLPFPVRDGFTEGLSSQFKTTPMDDGSTRHRRRWASQYVNNTVTWLLTDEQFKRFEAFVMYDVIGKDGLFEMALSSAFPLRTYQFGDNYSEKWDTARNRWVITATLKYRRPAPSAAPVGTIPVWPIQLGTPERDNYSVSTPDYMAFDSNDNGPQVMRQRFSQIWTEYQASFLIEDMEQYAIFDSFFNNVIAGGIAPFLSPFNNGYGMSMVRAKFKEAPKIEPAAAAFKLTCSFLTGYAPRMTYAEYISGNIDAADKIKIIDSGTIFEQTYAIDYFGEDYVGENRAILT